MRGDVCAASPYSQWWCLESVQKAGECYQMSYRGCDWISTFKIFTPVPTYWRWKLYVHKGGLVALMRFSWALQSVRYKVCKENIPSLHSEQGLAASWVSMTLFLVWGAGALGFAYPMAATLTLPYQAGKLEVLYFCPKSQGTWNMYHLWAEFLGVIFESSETAKSFHFFCLFPCFTLWSLFYIGGVWW